MGGIEKLQFEHAYSMSMSMHILDLGVKKCFSEILSKFHEKTRSRSGDIKNFPPDVHEPFPLPIYGRSVK